MGWLWQLLLWWGCVFWEAWWRFREKTPDLKLPSNYGFLWLYLMEWSDRTLRSSVSGLWFSFIIYTCSNSWFLSPSHFSSPIIEYYHSLLFSYNTILLANILLFLLPPPLTMKSGVWTTRTSMSQIQVNWCMWLSILGFVKGFNHRF